MESALPVIRTILQVLQAVSAFILICLVMVHSPKGDGIAGMGGASQVFASQKGAEAALNKITAYTAIAFYVVCFILGHYFRVG